MIKSEFAGYRVEKVTDDHGESFVSLWSGTSWVVNVPQQKLIEALTRILSGEERQVELLAEDGMSNHSNLRSLDIIDGGYFDGHINILLSGWGRKKNPDVFFVMGSVSRVEAQEFVDWLKS